MAPALVPGNSGESRFGEIVGIAAAFTGTSVIIVALRIYTRLAYVQQLKADDYIIVFACALVVFYGIDMCFQTTFGLGYHITDLANPANFAGSLKLFYAAEIDYYLIVGITKVSLLIFYLRIFTTQTFNLLRKLSWALLVMISLLTVIYVFVIAFQCHPVQLAWDKTIQGKCINDTAVFYTHAGINIFMDFVIYVMPMPMFWTVKRPLKERIALVVIFAIGGFVCLTGILRLASLKKAMSSDDPSWNNEPSAIWSAIEADTGVICASLPSLKPLFRDVLSKVSNTRTTISKSTHSRNFEALNDSQTGLQDYSRVDVELHPHPRTYKGDNVVVRTDEFRIERD